MRAWLGLLAIAVSLQAAAGAVPAVIKIQESQVEPMDLTRGGGVMMEDLGDAASEIPCVMDRFEVETGPPLRIRVGLRGDAVRSLQITNPYYIAEQNALAGLHYDAAKNKLLYSVQVDAASGAATDVVHLGAGTLLVGFGTQDFLDPQTGRRGSGLRLARVRYERR